MDVTTLRIIATLACFAVFVGILAWTFSKRQRPAFEQAAQIPFQQD